MWRLDKISEFCEKVKHEVKAEKYIEIVMAIAVEFRINGIPDMAKIRELLKGHTNLLLDFNHLERKTFEITPQLEKKYIKGSCDFLVKIQTKFEDDGRTFKSFGKLLHQFKNGNMWFIEFYLEVARLFRHDEDMLVEFIDFLPMGVRNRDLHVRSKYFHTDALYFSTDAISGSVVFWQRARQTLDKNNLQKVVRYVNSYLMEMINKSDFESLVVGVIERYPYLRKDFEDFLRAV